MACELAGQAGSNTGAARRRRLQAQRATGRHVEWRRRLGRDTAVHHTAANSVSGEQCAGPPRADLAQLLAVVRGLEAKVAELQQGLWDLAAKTASTLQTGSVRAVPCDLAGGRLPVGGPTADSAGPPLGLGGGPRHCSKGPELAEDFPDTVVENLGDADTQRDVRLGKTGLTKKARLAEEAGKEQEQLLVDTARVQQGPPAKQAGPSFGAEQGAVDIGSLLKELIKKRDDTVSLIHSLEDQAKDNNRSELTACSDGLGNQLQEARRLLITYVAALRDAFDILRADKLQGYG